MNYITYFPASTTTVFFKGYNFNYTSNIFLSTNNLSNTYSLTTISFNEKLSATNPEFTGFIYDNYKISSNNELQVYVYDLLFEGIYDIIIMDPAGYTKLSNRNYLIDASLVPPLPTPSITPTVTPTITNTPSITPSITPTNTITPTITQTPSITPSITPTNTQTSTYTPTTTQTPSITPTNTNTSSPTPTPTPTPTITSTITQTIILPTVTPSPTLTSTTTPSITPTTTQTSTITQTPSITPTITPTISITPSNTPTHTITPTQTPTLGTISFSVFLTNAITGAYGITFTSFDTNDTLEYNNKTTSAFILSSMNLYVGSNLLANVIFDPIYTNAMFRYKRNSTGISYIGQFDQGDIIFS